MKTIKELYVHNVDIEGNPILIVEAPKSIRPTGFLDSERKKLVENGFSIIQERYAIPPAGQIYPESAGDLVIAFGESLVDAKPSRLEQTPDAVVFPSTLRIDGEMVSAQAYNANGLSTLIYKPSPGGKVAEFLENTGLAQKSGESYLIDFNYQNVRDLEKKALSMGGSSGVNFSVGARSQMKSIPERRAVQNVVTTLVPKSSGDIYKKGKKEIVILPEGGEFSRADREKILRKLNYSADVRRFNAGDVLEVVMENGDISPVTLSNPIECLVLPATQRYNKDTGRYEGYRLNFSQQAEATKHLIHEYAQVAPIGFFQNKNEKGQLVGSSFCVVAPAELNERMRSIVGASRSLERIERNITGNSKASAIGQTYLFKPLDAFSVVEETKDLQSYTGQLGADQLAPRHSVLPDENAKTIDLAKDYYRQHIRSQLDAINLIQGRLNTPFSDDVVKAIESHFSSGDTNITDWQGTIENLKTDARGAWIVPAKFTKVHYNTLPKDKDMYLTLQVFSDNMVNIQLRKGGVRAAAEDEFNIAKPYFEWYQREAQKIIADVSNGRDYSRILAEQEARRAEIEASRKAREEEFKKRLEQQALERKEALLEFTGKYNGANGSITVNKEIAKKGLSHLMEQRQSTPLRAGFTQRDNSNYHTLYVPYTAISSAQPERDGKFVTGQTITHDGSASSSKLFIADVSYSEDGIGKGTTSVYATSKISDQYREYVITEGWAEAEWYKAHLEKRGINDVWVGAAGSAGKIPEVLAIINDKYPEATKVVLSDNDAYKLQTQNAGINAVLDGALRIKSENPSANLKNVLIATIPSKDLDQNGLPRITDITDLTSGLSTADLNAAFKTFGYEHVNAYRGDAASNSNKHLPDDYSPEAALSVIKSSKEPINININIAQPLLGEVLYEHVHNNRTSLVNTPVNKEGLGKDVSTAYLLLEKAKHQAQPVIMGMKLKEYVKENGISKHVGYSNPSPDNDDIQYNVDARNQIVHARGNSAGKPLIVNDKEVFLSSDGIISNYAADAGKPLAKTIKEGQHFSEASFVGLAPNLQVKRFFDEAIKESVNELFKNKDQAEAVKITHNFAKKLRENYMSTVEPRYLSALKGFVNTVDAGELSRSGHNYSEVEIGKLERDGSIQFAKGLADPDEFKLYVNQVASKMIAGLVQSETKSPGVSDVTGVSKSMSALKNSGKNILEAIDKSNGLFYFPAKNRPDSVIELHKSAENPDLFHAYLNEPHKNHKSDKIVLTRDEIASGKLSALVAYIPNDPMVARTEAFIRMQPEMQRDYVPSNAEEHAKRVKQIRKEAERQTGREQEMVLLNSFVESANVTGRTLGVRLSERVIDLKPDAEKFLKLPTLSMDMTFVSLRGNKEHTNESLIGKLMQEKLDAAKELEKSGAPSAVVEHFAKTEPENIQKTAQKAILRGDQKAHHTASKVGASAGVFTTDIAFVKRTLDGEKYYHPAQKLLRDLRTEMELAHPSYLEWFKQRGEKGADATKVPFTPFLNQIGKLTVRPEAQSWSGSKDTNCPYISVKKSVIPFARAVLHEHLSGSPIMAYKMASPSTEYTDDAVRLYRGSEANLEIVENVIQELKEKGINVTYQKMTAPVIKEDDSPEYKEKMLQRYPEGEKLFGLIVNRFVQDEAQKNVGEVTELINQKLFEKQLFSLKEFRHLEQPAHNESPYVKASDRGITEKQTRQLAWKYADNPPTSRELSQDDPLLIAKQREQARKELEQKQKQQATNQYAQAKNGMQRPLL